MMQIGQTVRGSSEERYAKYYLLRGSVKRYCCLLILIGCLMIVGKLQGQLPWSSSFRQDRLLDDDWKTVTDSSGGSRYKGFEGLGYKDQNWKTVQLPHNWDDYGGYIREKHGNRHGDGWYRKTFDAVYQPGMSYFLFFEGVSSYATVYLNGHLIGKHAGGRTSFSLEVTQWLNKKGAGNLLALKVEHPAGIRDLPWVCGGCSDEVGFSEGSQPLGIFRPVHLIRTGKVRIVPFGVHIYNDTTVNEKAATLYVATTVKSYADSGQSVVVRQVLLDRSGKKVAENNTTLDSGADVQRVARCRLRLTGVVHLWSLASPYLYSLKTIITDKASGAVLDELETPYGIRWIKWPALDQKGPKRFLLNGKPVFINGIAGYEHALGNSHAFTKQEIATRVAMIRSMGFNAFRDAHQPHNLRYQYYWDKDGVLWWPQFSAHIWFDTPAFRKNFLSLLRDWVLERRNSPSNIMWGLQNESRLPADFAKQCVQLIRSLDPTASSQRLITTCNGGEGTDWDVPQNWSGTYGGDPDTYNEDLKKEVLVGEYGGWRTMDVHSEGGFKEKGAYSIESWCALMEKKIRLAWKVRDSVCGQFLWLFNSHDNPGRVQAGEGYRDLDKIGPVNYKGLLTSWEEPTEAVYLYQSNFTKADTAPMVHIASHDWPGRWHSTRERKDIIVYSNCDSVRLYNGRGMHVLGTRTRGGIGTHFTWKNVRLNYNILFAVGYYNGKARVTDLVRLRNLPEDPKWRSRESRVRSGDVSTDILAPAAGYNYLYRFNCGGPSYTDHFGNRWAPDRSRTPKSYGSLSWTANYKGLPSFFASQRSITDPIKGTLDDALFQTFRYGRDKLNFDFPVPSGDYRVELYFAEPWWGIGSNMDCTGWRDFDVAVNAQLRLAHFDIFREAGRLKALKKIIDVHVKDGHIRIDFPRTYSGQAIIAAIAIASKKKGAASGEPQKVNAPAGLVSLLNEDRKGQESSQFRLQDWLSTGDNHLLKTGGDKNPPLPVSFSGLPAGLYGAEWLQSAAVGKDRVKEGKNTVPQSALKQRVQWIVNAPLDWYIGIPGADKKLAAKLEADKFINTHTKAEVLIQNGSGIEDSLEVYKKRVSKGIVLSEEPWWKTSLIAFKPVSNMQPPYDQKKEFTYDVTSALFSRGASRVKRAGKDCILFRAAAAGVPDNQADSIAWPLVTGVADFHSFHVKYACPGQDSLQATLKLVAADGKVMAESAVWLTHTKEGKWNNCFLMTPTMINAGRYQLVVAWKKTNAPVYMYSLKLR